MDVEVQGCLDIVFSLYRKKMEKGSEGLPMKKLKVETLYGFAIAIMCKIAKRKDTINPFIT